jgi:hypothetical protein
MIWDFDVKENGAAIRVMVCMEKRAVISTLRKRTQDTADNFVTEGSTINN